METTHLMILLYSGQMWLPGTSNLYSQRKWKAGMKISDIPTTPSQHGWCRPTNSHWAPPDPQVWAGTQTSTSGPSPPARCSSSWRPRRPLRGDTGSWSPGGSRWPRPCRDGREPEPPLLAAKTTPAPPEQDSCWTSTSVCWTSSQLPQFKLLRIFCCPDVLYEGVMCNFLLLGQIQKWTSFDILR